MEKLERLIGMFSPDEGWLGAEKEKYRRLFLNEEMESLPVSFAVRGKIPFEQVKFNVKEQYEDGDKMAFEQIRDMVICQNSKSSLLPSVRANLGTGFIPSLFGAEQEVYEDKMPWVRTHPSKEDIKAMSPSDFGDVSGKGLVPRAEGIYRLYGRLLGTSGFCYLPDTQGVLDIAHLVRGNELLYDVYDDPGFVHHLMELCTAAYINASRYLKKVIGEPPDGGMHDGKALYNGGVRYCMDTSVLFSAAQVEEFELPYLRRALGAFGGGWVHFCGYAPHLTGILEGIPEVRGVNPNYMNSRPYDYEGDIRRILRAGKFFSGAPFKGGEETPMDYFRRVLRPLERRAGLHFTPRGERLEITDGGRIKELWDLAQKEMLN